MLVGPDVNWTGPVVHSLEQAARFAHSPDIGYTTARRLEHKISSIRRPAPATLRRWAIPAGQQWMEAASIRRDFPDGGAVRRRLR